jgi:suppressor of ftsI
MGCTCHPAVTPITSSFTYTLARRLTTPTNSRPRLNLKPGTYWYHPHIHPETAPQVAGGLSGILIVDGLTDYLPPELRHIAEHVIALKGFQIDGDAVKTRVLHISVPTNRTVNGQINPTIHIRPGETQLWRLANISTNIYYNVRLRGQKFQVIGHDGFPAYRIWAADTLLLAAGARFDVLVQGGPPGSTVLESWRLCHITPGRPATSSPKRPWPPWYLKGRPCMLRCCRPICARQDLSNATIAVRRAIVLSETSAPTPYTQYYIDGKQFDPNRVDIQSKQSVALNGD